MTTRRIAAFAILGTILFSTSAPAQAVDDGHGKQWRQLTETTGASWNEVAQVCPRDGISACAGAAGGSDLTGWVWATDSEVVELFSNYTQDILTNTTVQGQQYFFAASAFLSSFRPTFSFFITYQSGQFAAGWTASMDAAGQPLAGSVSAGTTPVSFAGSFAVAAVSDPAAADGMRGVFLWRPTGLGTHAVIANDNVGQVPSPAGGKAVPDVLANDWLAGARACDDGEREPLARFALAGEQRHQTGSFRRLSGRAPAHAVRDLSARVPDLRARQPGQLRPGSGDPRLERQVIGTSRQPHWTLGQAARRPGAPCAAVG